VNLPIEGVFSEATPTPGRRQGHLVAYQRKKPLAIGVKAPFPGFIEPALATSIDKVPSGERWIHEIKFDGYRVQVHLRDAAVKVFTRRGNDWTGRFRKIAADAWHVKGGSPYMFSAHVLGIICHLFVLRCQRRPSRPVNKRDKCPAPRIATLHCATVQAPDSQMGTHVCIRFDAVRCCFR
jgi:ATP dependent DNA ligase domain